MGTLRSPKLSDAGICRLYAQGVGRREICLRSGLYDAEVVQVLARNGVRLRDAQEARAIGEANRRRTWDRLKLKRSAC